MTPGILNVTQSIADNAALETYAVESRRRAAKCITLTSAQRRYLESFRDDLDAVHLDMVDCAFAQYLAGLNFDGGASPGDFRVAAALQEKGVLSEVVQHSANCLSITFTDLGGWVLHRVLRG